MNGREVLVLRHEPHVPLGSLHDEFNAAGVAYRYVDLFDEAPARLPLHEAAGLVILGGTMNVDQTERFPFLAEELDWIREAIDRRVPTLGICLGAQLMAKALGQPVRHHSRKEIGWYRVELLPATSDDPLFAGSAPCETVFQWHGDTFDLPDGALHLAKTDGCASQAFRAGKAAWAVQFHVEMTAPLLREWLADDGFRAELTTLPYIDPAQILAEMSAKLPQMQAFSHQLLSRFVRLCQA
ncbi:MAG: type 1 glutamine amidotransferase [Planctomycetota bacterium]